MYFRSNPNPSDSEFDIISADLNIHQVEIYNVQGHQMYLKKASARQITINSVNLESGIYLVVITLEDHSKSLKKLIIQ